MESPAVWHPEHKVRIPLDNINIKNDEDLVMMLDFVTWNQHKLNPQFLQQIYDAIDTFHEQREERQRRKQANPRSPSCDAESTTATRRNKRFRRSNC